MFNFIPINEKYANKLLKIKEDDGYAVYDMDHHLTDIDNLLNNEEFDFFVGIDDDDEMVGFVECAFDDEGLLEVGCGLLRELMGHGFGFDFVSECIDYLVEHYDYGEPTIITYLKPNDLKTIKVFERVGFKITDESEEWIQLSIDV
jgi:RimJ/RimL family protein N-acetyltransferase